MTISLSDCEICSQLAEVETAFYKYGWDDMTRPLATAAGRLVPIENVSSYDKENDHIRRCPICGVYYHYRCTYEYLVNGSEDDVTLTRLTPFQARDLLPEGEYERLMAAHQQNLEHPVAITRGYAAKCLVSHHLAQNDRAAIETLFLHSDTAVVDGVLYFLVRLVVENGRLPMLVGWRETLSKLAASPEQQIAGRAAYLLKYGIPDG